MHVQRDARDRVRYGACVRNGRRARVATGLLDARPSAGECRGKEEDGAGAHRTGGLSGSRGPDVGQEGDVAERKIALVTGAKRAH